MDSLVSQTGKLSALVYKNSFDIKQLEGERRVAETTELKDAYTSIRKHRVLEIQKAVAEFWKEACIIIDGL